MSALDYLQIFGVGLIRQSPVLVLGIFGLWRAAHRKEQLGQTYSTAYWGFSMLTLHGLLGAGRDVASVAVRIGAEGGSQSVAETGVALTLLSAPAYFALLAALVLLGRAVLLGQGSGAGGRRRTSGAELTA